MFCPNCGNIIVKKIILDRMTGSFCKSCYIRIYKNIFQKPLFFPKGTRVGTPFQGLEDKNIDRKPWYNKCSNLSIYRFFNFLKLF